MKFNDDDLEVSERKAFKLFAGAGIAFIGFWLLCAVLGVAGAGLVVYILYRVAVLLSV